jgi:hypothetical protein
VERKRLACGLQCCTRRLGRESIGSAEAAMRTTIDLIKELLKESEGAVSCALVIWFENAHAPEFVSCDHSAADLIALGKLQSLLVEGGEPLGIIRVVRHQAILTIESRPLTEHADDPKIEK